VEAEPAEGARGAVIADLSAIDLLIVLAITAAGAIVQGSAGIGLGLVASPLLLSIDPAFGPGPLLLGGLVVGARHMTAEWDDLDRPTLRRLLVGLPFGVAAGLAILRIMAPDTLSLLIGLLICVAAIFLLSGLTITRTNTADVLTGASAAFTSISAALPGPPLVIGLADLPPRCLRCTVSVFVAVTSGVAFVGLMAIGRFGVHEAYLLALMVAGLVLGVVAWRCTRPLLDRHWFRPAILILSLAGGVALAINQL